MNSLCHRPLRGEIPVYRCGGIEVGDALQVTRQPAVGHGHRCG